MNDDTLILLNEGINLIFDKWTVLRLAVTNNWGGMNSEEKKKKLIEYVYNFVLSNNFRKNKLCDFLRDEMNTLFNVEIEDDSDIEIAELILELYENLKKKSFDILEKIRKIEVSDLSQSKEKELIDEVEVTDEEYSNSEYSDENYSNSE
ncbi:pre-rRNA-processing protein TSR2, putative [Plasmodium gallinaceum]|uniref:Pre-rRNA-processing protein TSR2, putative n=1 Tax=Plasmodium gallinaceum TaxID=5849 RepID=A0A1J1GPV0_PLAGA|nr:pre-rRNA-processing protein TSR2, putative [Plasmodium gallinaceum]CRG93319.1 pre-rRNA-processing protein TSR2, putative [Plasmodium gallinaceum]